MKTITLKIWMPIIGILTMFLLTGCPSSDGKNGEFSFENLLMSTPDNVSPVANAGVDQVTIIGSVITLDGTESYDEDGEIVSYEWLSADGTSLGMGAMLNISTLTFPAGVYEVTLLVTDDEGATHLDSLIITIHIPPSPTPPAVTPEPTPEPAPEPEVEEEPEPTPEPAANTAPVAHDRSRILGNCSSVPIEIGLNASDADGDSLVYSIVTQPASGANVVIVGNVATYTNTTAGCSNVPGSDAGGHEETFTFKVNDGTDDSNIATVSMFFNIPL